MEFFQDFDYSALMPLMMDVLGAIILLILTLLIAGWVGRMTRKATEKSKLDPTLSQFFSSMARYGVIVLGALTVLSVFGVSVASFAAVLAAAGFAVGLALQGTLSHFAAGVMLLVFRPFKVGDVVNVAGITGKVNDIGLFNTLIDTFDNRRLIVPNGSVSGSTIENINFHETRRVDVAVGTDYGADLQETRNVLESVAAAVDGGLQDPEPQVVLGELGASSIDWVVRVWVHTTDFWPVKERLTRDIKNALDAKGIGIPFPQMDVHLDNLPGDSA